MLAIMAAGAVALGIVLLAIRIVLGWVYKPAGVHFDRAVRTFGGVTFKLVIVAVATLIVAAMAAAFLK